MKKIFSACIVATSVAGVMPAGAQDATPNATPNVNQDLREYQVVSSRQMAAGQGASASQINSEIVQDVAQTINPDGSVAVTTTPTRATVGVSGAGTADVPLDDAPSSTVSTADLDTAAPPSAVTVVDNENDDGAATSLRVESDLPAPTGSGVSGGPVTVNTTSATATSNGEPVAAVTTYASEPISFTTAAGDTVVMRTEGFSATDPATGQPIASGSRAIGQTVTASGDLVPFAMQSSSAASPSGGGNGAGGNPVAGLGAVAGLLANYSGPLSSGPASGDGSAPPAWLAAVAGVSGGVDALASSATAPGAAAGSGSGGGAWAALGQANSNAADAVVGPAVAAAGGSFAGLGNGNGSGDGVGDGASGSNAGALADAARGAFGGADAGNGAGGSGVTVSSGAGASVAGSGFGGSGAGDPIAVALGNGGSADTAAFGGAAIYGSGPGPNAGLPDLSTQVVVSDQSVARNAVANLATTGTAGTAGTSLFSLPPSTGGFSTISVPNQLLTFSVFDSGAIDNEDVINITFINNGASVPVSPSGSNVTLFFLTNGQGTTFDAVGNPAVASNEFTVPVNPGTAELSFEAVSSINGGNTGAVEITSPVLSGENSQVFNLPQTGGDFARLNIAVQP